MPVAIPSQKAKNKIRFMILFIFNVLIL